MPNVDVRTVLIAAALSVTTAAPASAADRLPFLGAWRCADETVRFTKTVYNDGAGDHAITDVRKGGDGAYTLTIADDRSITLAGFRFGWMEWVSDGSKTCKLLGLKATGGGRGG